MERLINFCTSARGMMLLLGGFLLLGIPLMLAMPLTADPVLYDLQAQTVLDGGVLYRDIVEPNLPGIVWLHLAIRSLFGWSEFALKGVDLAIVGTIVFLLTGWMRGSEEKRPREGLTQRLFLALLLVWFYLGTSEWCHCQRDTWMFLPALCALGLRFRQIRRIERADTEAKSVFAWGMLEGIVWAVGFWIKPFIAIPALAAMAMGIWLTRRWRLSLFDAVGVLCGGLLMGGLGTSWLVASGTWPHFWTMAIEWNPTYFEVGRERWTWDRLWRQQLRFFPFSVAHLVAIPFAVRTLYRTIRRKTTQHSLEVILLSVAYLGWLLQTFYLQHLFDYIHVPEVMLAVTLAMIATSKQVEAWASRNEQLRPQTLSFTFATSFLILAAITNPATRWQRIQQWPTCLTAGSTPAVKTALQHFPLPHWEELEPVLEFLKQQQLSDGELTVHNVYLVHAYRQLELRPSTRFVYLDVLTRVFRDHQDEIVTRLDHSGHRYILSSLLENGLTYEECQQNPDAPQLPSAFPEEHRGEFPYHHPIVFRSGQYVIHKVKGTASPLNPEFSPLTRK